MIDSNRLGHHKSAYSPTAVAEICEHRAEFTLIVKMNEVYSEKLSSWFYSAYLNKVSKAHWGLSDPAGAPGPKADIKAAFETTYIILEARVHQLLALSAGHLSDQELVEELGRVGILSVDGV